jgi:KRAB domain-containing zinc finger protein
MDIEIKEEPIDHGIMQNSKNPFGDSSKAEDNFGAKLSDPLLEIEVKREVIQEPTELKTKKKVTKTKKKVTNEPTESNPKEKKVDTRIHQCPICNKIKSTRFYLTSHIRNVHKKDKKLECNQCDYKTNLSQSLKKHQLVHVIERNFKCSHCELSFKDQLALKKHSALVHEGLKQFTCEICAKSFGRADYLEKHLLTHSEERNFKCEICNDTFKISDTLNNHRRNVHNIDSERHCCHVCGKIFSGGFYLREHLDRHQDVRRFKCEFCKKGFNSKSNLQQHRSIHLNERKFQCHLCEKDFNLRITLNQHLRTHKDYQPEEVSEKRRGRKVGTNPSKIAINTEVDNKINLEKPEDTPSENVDVPFKVDQEIAKELENPVENANVETTKQEHQQPDNQPKIQATIEEKSALPVEMEHDTITKNLKEEKPDFNFETPDFSIENFDESGIQNIFVPSGNTNFIIDELEGDETRSDEEGTDDKKKRSCHVCGKKFKLPFHLREHLDRHQDVRRYKCNFCPKGFNSKSNLQQHRSIHLNERKFQCHLCEKAFNLKTSMNKHIRVVHGKDYCPKDSNRKYERRLARLYTSENGDEFNIEVSDVTTNIEDIKVEKEELVSFEDFSYEPESEALTAESTNFIIGEVKQEFHEEDDQKPTIPLISEVYSITDQKSSAIKKPRKKGKAQEKIKKTLTKKKDQKEIKSTSAISKIQENPENECPECGKKFKFSRDLRLHSSVHKDTKDVTCPKCDMYFKDHRSMKNHFKLKHNENSKSYECDFCGKIFKRRDYLVKHFTVHTNSRKFICEACGSGFKTADTLNAHVKSSHLNESEKNSHAKHSCTICGKSFTTPFHLREHLNRHQDVKPYKCEFCEKGFNTKSNLNQHRSSHLNEKKFKCHFCEKAFNLKIGLNQHLRTHNEMPIGQESSNSNRKFYARLKRI